LSKKYSKNNKYYSISEYVLNKSTYIVAEIGQAHDGSLGILHSLVEALAKTGVNAIKFQIHIADAESSLEEPFRTKFSYVDQTRIEYWKRMELTLSQWAKIKEKCEIFGLEFIATPFSNKAVDILEKLNVNKYKIGSGDLNNKLLIDKIARTNKELILSTGLTSMAELTDIVEHIKLKKIPFSLLQCTTKYPTPPEEIGLNWIRTLKQKFNCPVGLSDHSGTIYSSLGAVSLGANIIEAHATFDKRMFGPDSQASLNIDQFEELVKGIRFLEKANLDEEKFSNKNHLHNIFSKSLAVNRDINKGETINFNDLEGKKPGDRGIPAKNYESIIGKKLTISKKKWEFLRIEDFR
tara:strand:+ start:334 stop:1386 length:1053 start_codon:yes stop_codon:yes gene_type:complete